METHSVSWIPHGGSESFEPPDTEWAHVKCWNENQARQAVVYRTAWVKPFIKINTNLEYLNELRQINRERQGTPQAVSKSKKC